MTEEVPEYLYHYTDINTLALILKSKKIKFSKLSMVDDLSEGRTRDLGDMGRYVFVSSWTETSEESIPFWRMYTNNMAGVRIRFKSYPFQTYKLSEYNEHSVKVPLDIDLDKEVYIKPEFFFNGEFIALPTWKILHQIEYTNDQEKLSPNLIYRTSKNTVFKLGELGKYKREEWSFQDEWRYIIAFLPVSIDEMVTLGDSLLQEVYERLDEKISLPFESIFLDISSEAWNSMEITFGPCVTEGDKLIVESLVEKYCPVSVNIYNSVLENSIRT